MAQSKCSKTGNHCLQDYNQKHCGNNEPRMVIDEAKVKEHPYRDKEETGKDILERYEVAEGAVAVLRVRDHKPCQERSEGKRHTQFIRKHCHRQAEKKDAHEKELLAVSHCYQMQQPGHEPPVAYINEDYNA